MKFQPLTQAAHLAATTAIVVGFLGTAGTALAERDEMARHQTRIDPGVRYPGDIALKEGTVRMKGPDKGAYIERCSWKFDPTFGKGFGLTQSCVRYTMGNTK